MSKHLEPKDDSLVLLGQIMEAQLTETHAANNRVLEAVTRERDEARAELLAVQHAVCGLLDSGWMPTSEMLRSVVLFPSKELVAQYMPQQDQAE